MVYSNDYTYFEKQKTIVVQNKSADLNYTYKKIIGKAISGNNDKAIGAKVDIQTCKNLCSSEKKFECLSFDYITSDQRCNLSKAKKD